MALSNPYGAHNQYKQNSIVTASPQELTLMLYNGAVKFANQAILAIEEKNMPKAHEAITRTSDIITELNVTLKMEYELSDGLRKIYEYILDKLVDANVQKDTRIIKEEILPFLAELRDTWKQAMEIAKKK